MKTLMEIFKVENLTFSYPIGDKNVLENINLTVNPGEYAVLCGKSGSGKTTLMRHLKSVLTPYGKIKGQVYFEGTPLNEVDAKSQSAKIGFVMQNPEHQIVTDKVWHELAFGLESIGKDQKTIRLRVAEMASYFGISTLFHKDINELSGGQKQMVNLASVMAMEPSVLILDEPTAQLDPIAASDFLNTIRKINSELGTTIIISEHRLEEIFPCADRVIVMDKGKIIHNDEPRNMGKLLMNSHMALSLPSPMRIYHEIKGMGDFPLTVREGRDFLTNEFAGREIKVKSIEDEEKSQGEEVLRVKNLWFRYSKNSEDILKDVSFSVAKGQLFAIVGGNGSGKSTLLKAVADVCRPYRGTVRVFGKYTDKYRGNELYNNCLAMLPQDPQNLFVKNTVLEDLKEMGRDTEKVIEDCEISKLLSIHPYDLSGGEQQRAALAKVLLTNPRIILLDEPTKGIDNYFKAKLATVLKRLLDEGTSIIMVTHDIEFCAKYAHRVAMLFDGSIVTENSPRQFFSQNSFYTTAANRMSRHLFQNAITDEDVVNLWKINTQQKFSLIKKVK